jgi:dihydroflavonol-4-reductase
MQQTMTAETNLDLRNVAVFGATGFIGSHLLVELVRRGFRVQTLVRTNVKAACLERLGAHTVMGDIRDPGAVRATLQGCGTVYHLATHRRENGGGWKAFRETNVEGTANIMNAAAVAGIQRLVFTSSVAVYGRLSSGPATERTPPRPILYHDRTKLAAEQMVIERARATGILAVAARLPLVLGPGERGARKMFLEISSGMPIRYLGRADPWRNVVHVTDVVDGLIRCAARASEPGTYLIAGHNARLSEILTLLASEAGTSLRVRRAPIWPVAGLGYLCRRALGPFGIQPRLVHGLEFFIRNQRLDGSLAAIGLGYTPRTSLGETIRQTLEWHRATNFEGTSEAWLERLAGADR